MTPPAFRGCGEGGGGEPGKGRMGDRGEVRKRSRSERSREKKAAAGREPPRGSALGFSAAPPPEKPLRRCTHRSVKGWGWVVSPL